MYIVIGKAPWKETYSWKENEDIRDFYLFTLDPEPGQKAFKIARSILEGTQW